MSGEDSTERWLEQQAAAKAREAERRKNAAGLMAALLSNPGLFQGLDRGEPTEATREELRHAAKAAVFGAEALQEELDARRDG